MKKIIAVIAWLVVVAFFLVSSTKLHSFGEPEPEVIDMDEYIIRNGQNETGANNIVTAVLFDYRGFDTLGEASVLFTAVTGVFAIFRRVKK